MASPHGHSAAISGLMYPTLNKLLISTLLTPKILLLSQFFPSYSVSQNKKQRVAHDSFLSYPKSDPIAYSADSLFRIYLESHPLSLVRATLVQDTTLSRWIAEASSSAPALSLFPFYSVSTQPRVMLENNQAPIHRGGSGPDPAGADS